MILLDTHIWIWWLNQSNELPADYRASIDRESSGGLGLSLISCWELAKLVEYGRIELSRSLDDWFQLATQPPIQLLPLNLEILKHATQLPGKFHRDPADQMIVATSRILNIPLLSLDRKILSYSYVQLVNRID